MMTALTINANALHVPLADASVQCIATSPPYYGLRDYGLPPTIWGGEPECEHVWGEHQIGKAQRQRNGASGGLHEGRAVNGLAEIVQTEHSHGSFCHICGAWRGCLGLEPTPELYVAHMVAIGRELRRVLREDGVFFLNLGDSYFGGKGSNGNSKARRTADERGYVQSKGTVMMNTRPLDMPQEGLKPKDLIGIPWRVALALQADGWYLRSEIIWAKPNPMPESVTDRPTKAHETIFLLAKSARYFWDQEAVREPHKRLWDETNGGNLADVGHKKAGKIETKDTHPNGYPLPHPSGRNIRSVWTIATSPYSGAHFATWPPKLVEPMILAGTSARGCCPKCGRPWERVVEKESFCDVPRGSVPSSNRSNVGGEQPQQAGVSCKTTTLGWRTACDCDAGEAVPCTVLDPFCGSGTTGRVAIQHGRRFIGLDLNGGYLGDLASERLDNVQVRLSL